MSMLLHFIRLSHTAVLDKILSKRKHVSTIPLDILPIFLIKKGFKAPPPPIHSYGWYPIDIKKN